MVSDLPGEMNPPGPLGRHAHVDPQLATFGALAPSWGQQFCRILVIAAFSGAVSHSP